jgi:hypothetical protein
LPGEPGRSARWNGVGNSQRIGSNSNSQVGSDFEAVAQSLFLAQGIVLEKHLALEIGIEGKKKAHKFDLGSTDPEIIVECKSHKWTETGNMPTAKTTTWVEAMYYFYTAPKDYRKHFFVLKDYSTKRHLTLAEYYLRMYEHLSPSDVEFWEYDDAQKTARRIR